MRIFAVLLFACLFVGLGASVDRRTDATKQVPIVNSPAESRWTGLVEQHEEFTSGLEGVTAHWTRDYYTVFYDALPTMYRNVDTTNLNFSDDKGAGLVMYHSESRTQGASNVTNCTYRGKAELHAVVIREADHDYDIEVIGTSCKGGISVNTPGGTDTYDEDGQSIIISMQPMLPDRDILFGNKVETRNEPGVGRYSTTITWFLKKEPVATTSPGATPSPRRTPLPAETPQRSTLPNATPSPRSTRPPVATSPPASTPPPTSTPSAGSTPPPTTTPSTTMRRVQCGECPKDVDFWRQNPDAWPVESLTLGGRTYTKQQLLSILNTPIGSGATIDPSVLLARQLIAIKLNVQSRCGPETDQQTMIGAIDALLALQTGTIPFGTSPDSAQGKVMIGAAVMLENYNTGEQLPSCVNNRKRPA